MIQNDENDLRLYCVTSDITNPKDNPRICYTDSIYNEQNKGTKQRIIILSIHGMLPPTAPLVVSPNKYPPPLCAKNLRNLCKLLDTWIISREKLKTNHHQIPKPDQGRPPLLTKDEETLVVATAEQVN